MAYHDDLLTLGLQLVDVVPPTQANVRRAVSSAYYAVFHLLIAEATSHWSNPSLRPALGRGFDHGLMKTASNRVSDTRLFPFVGADPRDVTNLRSVAKAFAELQEDRHFADYNLIKDLDPSEARNQVAEAVKIFQIWPTIRHTQIAEEYLVSLFVKQR
jgi:hypothetical protein